MVINELNPKITGSYPVEQEIKQTQEPEEAKTLSSGISGSVFAGKIRKIISTRVENNQGIAGRAIGKGDSFASRQAGRQEENLKILKNTLSPSVAGELKGEEKSLQDMSPEELVKAVIRIRKQNVEKQEYSRERAEKQDAEEEELMKASLKSADPSDLNIMQLLDAMDLSGNDELAGQIMLAASMAVECQDITDSQRIFMVKEDEFTVRKLYEAGHAGDIKPQKESSEKNKAFEEIRPQIENLIEGMGILQGQTAVENSAAISWDKAMEYSGFLFNNELPITEENIEKLANLDRFAQMGVGEMLEEIVYQTSLGKMPEKTDLSLTHGRAAKEVERFKADIEREENSSEKGSLGENNADSTIDALTKRRQIEEIRIKLTVESGYRIMKQGVSLDISKIQQVIDGLKELEKEYFRNILKEEGTEGNSTQIELLRNTTESLEALKTAPADVLGVSFNFRFSMTIERLMVSSDEVINADYKDGRTSFVGARAELRYETLATAPRADLGDSITKAFENVPDILKDLSMENTEENQRAVRILGRCGMEITQQSVHKIKVYDGQVNHLLSNLHPRIAARMIKEGINPVNTPIYELNRKIDEMRQEMGITRDESYSSYLWKLEHTEGISSEERSGYIGLFRLLNQIQTRDREAIGKVVESGREMTLSNLLGAVRTKKAEGFDKTLERDFQGLSSLTYETSSITAQISRAFSGNNEGMPEKNKEDNKGVYDGEKEKQEDIQYYNQLVDDIMGQLQPEKIAGLLSEDASGKGIMNLPLEELFSKMASGGPLSDEAYENGEIEEELAVYKELMDNSGEEIRFLRSLDQPVTLANLFAMGLIKNGGGAYFRRLFNENGKSPGIAGNNGAGGNAESAENNEAGKIPGTGDELRYKAESILDEMTDEESFLAAQDEFLKMAGESISEDMHSQNISHKSFTALRKMSMATGLLSGLKREQHYEIPVFTEKGVTGVSLTVMPGRQEGGRVRIIMEDIFGEINYNGEGTYGSEAGNNAVNYNAGITAEFSIHKGQVNGYIAAEKKGTADILENNRQAIENAITENNVEIGKILISSRETGNSARAEEAYEAVDTGVLYRLAKSYIKAVAMLP